MFDTPDNDARFEAKKRPIPMSLNISPARVDEKANNAIRLFLLEKGHELSPVAAQTGKATQSSAEELRQPNMYSVLHPRGKLKFDAVFYK